MSGPVDIVTFNFPGISAIHLHVLVQLDHVPIGIGDHQAGRPRRAYVRFGEHAEAELFELMLQLLFKDQCIREEISNLLFQLKVGPVCHPDQGLC